VTGGYAEMSERALRLAREEPDEVLRLQAFRAAHPEVIIGDGDTLCELLDKLDELSPERADQAGVSWRPARRLAG
jgi:hypothetical protein